jgi:hypothetical protein
MFTAPQAWRQPPGIALDRPPLQTRIGDTVISMTNTELSASGSVVALAEITSITFPGWNHAQGASNRLAITSHTASASIATSVPGRALTQQEHDGLQELLDRLWIGVLPRVVADSVDHVNYGLALHLGPLRIERHGFGTGAQMFPWSSYGGIRHHANGIEVMRHDGAAVTPVVLIGSGDTNAPAAAAILRYLASHVGQSQPMSDADRRALDLGPRPRLAFVAAPLPYVVPPKKRRDTSQLRKALVTVAVLALFGLRGYTMFKPDDSTSSPARPKTVPVQVSSWDARMVDLVAFVEKEHGQPFKHPVKVTFLDDAAFLARLNRGDRKPNRKQEQTTEALLRARGYAGASFSLTASNKEVKGLTGGVYFPDTDEIAIRGNELDAFGKLVVVHELTHSWQHQAYPIDKLEKTIKTDSDLFIYRTLLEGDARRIENRYYRSRPEAEQAAITAGENSARGDGSADAIPGPILALTASPYELGSMLTTYLASSGELDRQFDAFKLDQRRVLLPELPAATESAAVKPTFPTLKQGQKALTFNEYQYGYFPDGALSLFLTLSSRLDAADAWRAATVPGLTVTSVPYRDGDLVCEKTRLQSAPEPQAVVQATLERWVAASPATSASLGWSGAHAQSSVTVTSADGSLVLTSCDPGTAAQDPPKEIFNTLVRFVLAERIVGSQLHADNIDGARATCTLETFRARFDAQVITDEEFQSQTIPASVAEASKAALAGC